MQNRFLLHFIGATISSIEYWKDYFDDSINCKSEGEVEDLSKSSSECKTEAIVDGDLQTALSSCVTSLNQDLITKCADSDIKSPGKLLYCAKKGNIKCCFKSTSLHSYI